ncbi:protein argonaute-2-like isoform X3 [Panicum hallii]|uniref:protein argonaute-2-like isoform X3 n=1 Tax=Panicum hallii TaxID=206008 RepID=UPI000DF4CD8A|nr:protein argonaute-2-like isoform X3 [Panicum hallii]
MENGGEGEGGGGDDYTRDGSVDLRGNPARRSKRGGWTACTFIVGHRRGRQQRHQLVGHRLPHAAPRGLRRRRLPRPLLDLRRRIRRLPHGDAAADVGGLRAGAEAAALRRQRRRHLPARLRSAAGRLLRRAVHHRAGPRRHEAQHLHHRRRPVRRLPPGGAPAEALLLQLVDVHRLHGHPLLHHRARLPPGQRQLVVGLRRAHARACGLRRHLPRRHAAVPPQAAAGQPDHEDGQGGRRVRVEMPRRGARGPRRAARGGARVLHQPEEVPRGRDELHEVPEQGGGQGGGRPRVGAVHGDAGGGDEADREAGAAAGHHVRAVRADGAGGHALRPAGRDAGPPPRARRVVPGAPRQPRRVRDADHARLRGGLRPRPRPRRPAAHQEPARDHAPPAHRRRAAPPGRDDGGHGGGREPSAELREEPRGGRGRRAPAAADHLRPAAAVRADGRRRRVPGGGADRVLLRPGPREHEEPGHGHVPDGVRRGQHAEQRRPRARGARHGRQGRALGGQRPQRVAPRLLLRVPRRARRGEPCRVRGAELQILVQGGVHGGDRRHGESAL